LNKVVVFVCFFAHRVFWSLAKLKIESLFSLGLY